MRNRDGKAHPTTLSETGGQMRRAIAAAVMGGLVLGGAAGPALATVPAPAKEPGTAPKAAAQAAAMKTVVYDGYAFEVPASWPVYRLDLHPRTCVRYDVHAVYLGTPGANMDCPAGLVGRTQAVSFIPARNAAPGPGGRSAENAGRGRSAESAGNSRSAGSGGNGRPAQPEADAGTELQRLPAV